jgi:hypothetical protein
MTNVKYGWRAEFYDAANFMRFGEDDRNEKEVKKVLDTSDNGVVNKCLA